MRLAIFDPRVGLFGLSCDGGSANKALNATEDTARVDAETIARTVSLK